MRLKFQILFFLLTLAYSQDFLHVGDNGKIVDGNDEPILLRGFGLGGWLVQEGYMWGIGGFFASHTNIKNEILSLLIEIRIFPIIFLLNNKFSKLSLETRD